MRRQVELTHSKCLWIGNNAIFSASEIGVTLLNEIDIPIDLVDDGVAATGNRRRTVRAFRCHGTKQRRVKYSKVMALRSATGLFMQMQIPRRKIKI